MAQSKSHDKRNMMLTWAAEMIDQCLNEKKILCERFHLAPSPYGISHKVTGSFRFCFALGECVDSSHWIQGQGQDEYTYSWFSFCLSTLPHFQFTRGVWSDSMMTLIICCWFHCRHDHKAPPPSVNQGQQSPGDCGSRKWYGHIPGLLNSICHHLGLECMIT